MVPAKGKEAAAMDRPRKRVRRRSWGPESPFWNPHSASQTGAGSAFENQGRRHGCARICNSKNRRSFSRPRRARVWRLLGCWGSVSEAGWDLARGRGGSQQWTGTCASVSQAHSGARLFNFRRITVVIQRTGNLISSPQL